MDETTPSEDLMALTGEGDERAFEVLVLRHQGDVLNLIYRFVGDRSRAEDVAQEVFVRVWQAAKGYTPRAKFTTWMYRIAANLCLNELKSVRRRRLIPFHRTESVGPERGEEILPNGTPSAEEALLADERRRQVTDAIGSLPQNQRMALILKRFDGLSYQEIAQVLGCSVSAVESLLVRAKRTLRKKLVPGKE